MNLIDADKFLNEQIRRCHCIPLVGSCDKDSESLKLLLDQASTIDPVVHGRWLSAGERDVYFCSECDEEYVVFDNRPEDVFRFCPHCGAKMDGGMRCGA